jgi:hypothetical protein
MKELLYVVSWETCRRKVSYPASRKCGAVQIFGNDSNKTKFDSGGNLLPFSPEPFVLLSTV